MCGILFNIGSETIDVDHPALEVIKHRGPDDVGAETFELDRFKIGMGHRRLSIIDLSERGRQPMSHADGRFWITYNGEIYNYLELRDELRGEGFEFVSDSDTEVLLAAWMKWGEECLHRLNGMFAFCLFDRRENRVVIARDRFGIKPLYYYNGSKTFRAASEIKQFPSLEGFDAKVNPLKLYHFLNTGDFSFDDETLWKDVHELSPGHLIALNLNSWSPGETVAPKQWYHLPENVDFDGSFEDAVVEFRQRLDDAVRLRLRADVPLGFLLSGGLDSSTLVGLAHQAPRERGAHLRVYSSCYDDPAIDERQYIKAMVDHVGADSCLHFPKAEEIADHLDEVIWHNDIPVQHGSPVPHSMIYRHIKGENDSRKVILEGQGADESLCGYGDFHWAYFYELLAAGSWTKLAGQLIQFERKHREPLKFFPRKWRRIRFPESMKHPANPGLNAAALLGDVEPPPRPISREAPSVAALHRNRLVILRYILHNVDRNSMAQSRETRVPFLDHNIVELCLRMPSAYKIHDGVTKRVLRQAVADVLPDKVMRRVDKQGYSSPTAKWAAGPLTRFFEENLRKAAKRSFVNGEVLLANFQRFAEGKGHFDPFWWRLIGVDHWLNMYKIS